MEGYTRTDKPWGHFEQFVLNEPCTVKLITLLPNQATSLQRHEHRDEKWRVVRGSGRLTLGATTTNASPGDMLTVMRGELHRIEGGPEGLELLEVALGTFDEDDIIRVEDRYGRV
jgi:mannose-6-phosphate isomerase